MRTIRLNEHITPRDKIILPKMGDVKSGLWAKTEIIGGYGYNENPLGKSTLDEEVFSNSNMVPVGGVSYVFQRLFEIPDDQITVPTLYSSAGGNYGAKQDNTNDTSFLTPDEDNAGRIRRVAQYQLGHCVQLFGIGNTGAENDVTVYPVDYRERFIDGTRVSTDNTRIDSVMLPFRFVGEDTILSVDDRKRYFGKKESNVNGERYIGYYLKRFESWPTIKHIWNTGDDIDEETLVSDSQMWQNINGLNAVESFVEIHLKITKKDLKEFYTFNLGTPENTRFNTIALFNGEYEVDTTNPADYGDYRNVRMFSKLCIHPEYLDLNKDLNILYRVYGQ